MRPRTAPISISGYKKITALIKKITNDIIRIKNDINNNKGDIELNETIVRLYTQILEGLEYDKQMYEISARITIA